MGDVVHNLPVASDIRLSIPDAHIAWVVEEPYAAIPGLHAAVERVIPVAVRRWRKTLWRRQTRDEIREFLRQLREQSYDAVIDTQGLLKSALVACAARGRRCGLDWESAREPLTLFYDQTFNVPWTLHAVERNRSLAAQALGYALPARVDYGARAAPVEFSWMTADRYIVLLHATSADRKLWREANWIDLGRYFRDRGVACVLPWGSSAEHARSLRLAARISGAIVPPALALGEAAALMTGADAAAGVDTGLVHLAAALGTPTIGIYCATDPGATGIYACQRALNLGGAGKPPATDEVIAALERILA